MEFDETLRQSIETNKRNAQGYFSKTLEVQKRLSGLVGRASSGDGRVSVGFTTGGALSELHIDPRAMRMGADELTRTLLDLAAEAQADLKRQTEEIVSEAYGDQNPAEMFRDPEKFAENLRAMRDAFSGAMGESVTALNELKRRMQA
ncbi:YbaB/EbfC family nucleoid-associated protein [Actinomadura formosensis]|uniref:YbaB/EbfC family nucleoid-associated protein n=1 Tax=Actinomadura formosensis TaxID=60706 RepID=UPI00082E2589|nr:YbaB/EbfC family nucleoid-associated protein [Actinomadura formosensis]